MIQLSDEQLNNLDKEALVIIVSSLQDQLLALQSQLDHANAQLSDNNRQIELLTEQIRIMNQRFFGRRSESAVSDIDGQISLFDSFNEAEYMNQEPSKEPAITEVIIPSYHRKKAVGKRESDLSGLPARIIEHTLSDGELAVKFPDGYKELPAEVYKRLHIIPETFIVDEHHVHVYASKNNDGTILKAPRPKDLFRNSIATPALVASIINGKYTNALPLERQSKAFKTNGIQLSTNTMANWVVKSADVYLSLIYDRLHELIYDSKVIHADESPVKVMRIDHAKIKNGKKTYMWVYRNRTLRGTHYLLDFVSNIKVEQYSEQIKELSYINLLNFNYTYTYASVYGKNSLREHHRIHGDCLEEDMVLGIPDESFPSTLDYIYFQKYFQRIQKRTGNYYKSWITEPNAREKSLEDVPINVFIMGHSLADSDKGILKEIFMNDFVCKITIFYHSQLAYEQQVINLVSMFGKDFVIEQTANDRIVFEKLKKPQKRVAR